MKRIYFIFCGFAVASCMNVLAALRMENFHTIPSAVCTLAVSPSFSDEINSIGDYKKYTEEKNIAKDCDKYYYSVVDHYEEERTSRERNFDVPDFKIIHDKSFELSSTPPYNSTYKIVFLISFCRSHINFESLLPLYGDVETRQPAGYTKYSPEDSKNLQCLNLSLNSQDKQC